MKLNVFEKIIGILLFFLYLGKIIHGIVRETYILQQNKRINNQNNMKQCYSKHILFIDWAISMLLRLL